MNFLSSFERSYDCSRRFCAYVTWGVMTELYSYLFVDVIDPGNYSEVSKVSLNIQASILTFALCCSHPIIQLLLSSCMLLSPFSLGQLFQLSVILLGESQFSSSLHSLMVHQLPFSAFVRQIGFVFVKRCCSFMLR